MSNRPTEGMIVIPEFDIASQLDIGDCGNGEMCEILNAPAATGDCYVLKNLGLDTPEHEGEVYVINPNSGAFLGFFRVFMSREDAILKRSKTKTIRPSSGGQYEALYIHRSDGDGEFVAMYNRDYLDGSILRRLRVLIEDEIEDTVFPVAFGDPECPAILHTEQ